MDRQKVVDLLNSSENECSKCEKKNGKSKALKQRLAIHTKIQSNF